MLLDSLFLDTEHAMTRREIYSFVKGRIFPNADEYINFLQLSDMNEKRELAKRIIKRLCMFSNYQLPSEIIINVSQYERSKENQSIDQNYLPQDHFVHIVNTYIFGVYLYFEHPSLARELNLLFSDKRKGDNYLRKINVANDFIRSWKSFCLFHDVGYPFEIYYGKDKSLSEETLKELQDFDNVYTHLKNQLAFKALAKLVVINGMIKDIEKNRNFRDVSNSYKFNPIMCDGQQLHGHNMEFMKNYYELEDIYSYEHFKMFLGFIEQKNVMKILFGRLLGHPIAFLFTDENGKELVYKNAEITLPMTDEELKSVLQRDDRLYDLNFEHNYELKYYIKDLAASFEKKLHRNIKRIDLDNILELVEDEENISLDFKQINCGNDLDNLIFDVYEAITKMSKAYSSDFKIDKLEEMATANNFDEIYSANRKNVCKNYIEKKISEEITNYFTTDLKKQNDNTDKLVDNLSKEPYIERPKLSEHILEYIKKVFSPNELEKINKHIVDQAINTLITEIKWRDSLVQSYAVISNIISSNTKEVKADKFISKDGFDIKSLLNFAMKNEKIKAEYLNIEKNMLNKKHVSIDNLIKKYNKHTRYDHGICSGVIYLYVNSVSSFFAEKISGETDEFTKMLIPLFWAINPKSLDTKLLSNYKHIYKETFHAIFCHNIFADRANSIFKLTDDKKWTTRIDKEAFLYFCMLCDSLQHWERDKYYDPRTIRYTPLFAMDSYNVSIKNDKITIKAVAYTDNYDDIVKKFNYDNFLEDCSKYLSLEIKPR